MEWREAYAIDLNLHYLCFKVKGSNLRILHILDWYTYIIWTSASANRSLQLELCADVLSPLVRAPSASFSHEGEEAENFLLGVLCSWSWCWKKLLALTDGASSFISTTKGAGLNQNEGCKLPNHFCLRAPDYPTKTAAGCSTVIRKLQSCTR